MSVRITFLLLGFLLQSILADISQNGDKCSIVFADVTYNLNVDYQYSNLASSDGGFYDILFTLCGNSHYSCPGSVLGNGYAKITNNQMPFDCIPFPASKNISFSNFAFTPAKERYDYMTLSVNLPVRLGHYSSSTLEKNGPLKLELVCREDISNDDYYGQYLHLSENTVRIISSEFCPKVNALYFLQYFNNNRYIFGPIGLILAIYLTIFAFHKFRFTQWLFNFCFIVISFLIIMYDVFRKFDESLIFFDYPLLVAVLVGILGAFIFLKFNFLSWFILGAFLGLIASYYVFLMGGILDISNNLALYTVSFMNLSFTVFFGILGILAGRAPINKIIWKVIFMSSTLALCGGYLLTRSITLIYDPDYYPQEIYLAQKYNFYWTSKTIYIVPVLFQMLVTILLAIIQIKASINYEYDRFFRRPELLFHIRDEEEAGDEEIEDAGN